MLALITGVPGAKKTVFTVSKLDKIETENKVNLVKNIAFYSVNQKVIEDNNLHNDFTYYYDEVGSGHDIKQVLTLVPQDYFAILSQDYDDLRPDDYYKVATIYNAIVSRVIESEAIKGLQYLLPVRTIYTNINALKIDFVRSLYDLLDNRDFVDWRKAPDGSIIVIDEIQLVEPFKSTKNKDEPIVQDLTVHRHRGFDFYFITQSANLLHVQLKDLIGLHWHITVPWGWVSKVYQYGSYRQNPNAVSIKMSAERKFNFSPPDRLFKLYKSTTINTHQKRIPYKAIILFLFVIFFAIGMFVWAATGSKDSTLIKGMTGQELVTADNPAMPVPSAAENNTADNPAMPVPSAAAAENNAAVMSAPAGVFNPIDGTYITNPNLVPNSVVSFGNKCAVYNKSGALLNHITRDVCDLYLTQKGLLPTVAPKTANIAPKLPNNV